MDRSIGLHLRVLAHQDSGSVKPANRIHPSAVAFPAVCQEIHGTPERNPLESQCQHAGQYARVRPGGPEKNKRVVD
jgi:hypothetical protein